MGGHLGVLEVLVEFGADLNAADNDGNTGTCVRMCVCVFLGEIFTDCYLSQIRS